MKGLYVFYLLLIGMALTSDICRRDAGSAAPADDCSGQLQSSEDWNILSAAKPNWVSMTPAGAGDCTSLYYFYFQWADPKKRANDNHPPPIQVVFTPSGPPGYVPDTSKVNVSLNSANQQKSDWWLISFAPTPTTTTGNTTKFTVNATLPGSIVDSVNVYRLVSFRHSPN